MSWYDTPDGSPEREEVRDRTERALKGEEPIETPEEAEESDLLNALRAAFSLGVEDSEDETADEITSRLEEQIKTAPVWESHGHKLEVIGTPSGRVFRLSVVGHLQGEECSDDVIASILIPAQAAVGLALGFIEGIEHLDPYNRLMATLMLSANAGRMGGPRPVATPDVKVVPLDAESLASLFGALPTEGTNDTEPPTGMFL